jgi:hypothetical protein
VYIKVTGVVKAKSCLSISNSNEGVRNKISFECKFCFIPNLVVLAIPLQTVMFIPHDDYDSHMKIITTHENLLRGIHTLDFILGIEVCGCFFIHNQKNFDV